MYFTFTSTLMSSFVPIFVLFALIRYWQCSSHTSRLQALVCPLLCQYLFCSLSYAIGNVLHILHVYKHSYVLFCANICSVRSHTLLAMFFTYFTFTSSLMSSFVPIFVLFALIRYLAMFFTRLQALLYRFLVQIRIVNIS